MKLRVVSANDKKTRKNIYVRCAPTLTDTEAPRISTKIEFQKFGQFLTRLEHFRPKKKMFALGQKRPILEGKILNFGKKNKFKLRVCIILALKLNW